MKRKAESEPSNTPNSKTKRKLNSELSANERRKEYRHEYEDLRKRRYENFKFQGIERCIFAPNNINMETFCGTTKELSYHIERLYANYGG
jgi:hypothetical protein